MSLRQSRPGLLALGLLAVAGCSSGSTTSDPPPAAPTARTSTPSSTPTDSTDTAAAACFARPAIRGDIILRKKVPKLPYAAQLLGGGYVYNQRSNQCQSSVEYSLDTVSDQPGFCVEIALDSDNPGYSTDARPAPPLKKIIASKGSC